jgi:hypothetical protein
LQVAFEVRSVEDVLLQEPAEFGFIPFHFEP